VKKWQIDREYCLQDADLQFSTKIVIRCGKEGQMESRMSSTSQSALAQIAMAACLVLSCSAQSVNDKTFKAPGKDAVPRSSQEKLQETISVLDFGADDTGTADSTTAIQNAMNAASAYGAAHGSQSVNLIFPPGKYKCGALTWPNYVNLVGQWPIAGTTLLFAGKDNTVWITRTAQSSVFRVTGIFFDSYNPRVARPSNIISFSSLLDFTGRVENNAFAYSRSDALVFSGAWANLHLNKNRWDNIGGYAADFIVGEQQFLSFLEIDDFTYDNGTAAMAPGVFKIDNSVGYSFPTIAHISGARIELNAALGPPYAILNLAGALSNWTMVEMDNLSIQNVVPSLPTAYLLVNTGGAADNSFTLRNIEQSGLTSILNGPWPVAVNPEHQIKFVLHGGSVQFLDALTVTAPVAFSGTTTFSQSPNFNGGARLRPVHFVNIPVCSPALEGTSESIDDSAIVTWGTPVVSGGGINHVKLYCDGANWTVESR
jgi:hypothetical protein